MTSSARLPRVIDPGAVIAAIPALLSFPPTDSVVLLGLPTTATGRSPAFVARADIPPATQVPALVAQLCGAIRANEVDRVVVVIITESTSDRGDLPQAGLQQALVAAAEQMRVEVVDALWVPRIEPGRPWRSYREPERGGVLPDPNASPFTAAAVLLGMPVYASRDELIAQLAHDPAPVLARRAGRLAALPSVQPEPAARLLGEVLDRLAADPTGAVVVEEDTLLRLAHALTHRGVRQVALECALTALAEPAGRLWTVLTRATPPPVVTHPAGLLAATAYLRGDGALANIALDIALAADPANLLAQCVRTCVDHGVPPAQLRQLLTASLTRARPTSGSPGR